MQKNKFKKSSLIVSILFFLFTCVIFLFLYRGVKNNIEISKQAQSNFEQEMLKRADIKDFNESFKSIEQSKAQLETHFAQGSDIVPFLDKLEDMANSVGTKSDVSFIEVAKDNSGLSIEMKDIGSFSQVYKFLMLLENSPYEIEFDSVDIHNTDVSSNNKYQSDTKNKKWEVFLKMKLITFI